MTNIQTDHFTTACDDAILIADEFAHKITVDNSNVFVKYCEHKQFAVLHKINCNTQQ